MRKKILVVCALMMLILPVFLIASSPKEPETAGGVWRHLEMSPLDSSSQARILIRIQELARRLGALKRRIHSAPPSRKPIIEIGINVIQQELADLSRKLR